MPRFPPPVGPVRHGGDRNAGRRFITTAGGTVNAFDGDFSLVVAVGGLSASAALTVDRVPAPA
ncbi:MAG: hypothetical protein R2882_13230 [Gemmatimonadales bacterium]